MAWVYFWTDSNTQTSFVRIKKIQIIKKRKHVHLSPKQLRLNISGQSYILLKENLLLIHLKNKKTNDYESVETYYSDTKK